MSARRVAAAALALCLGASLLPVRAARAAEDGGTRSPLAAGAGTRSLALGGAFVAIAADAEALAWNPAGLALATRTGFEAAHDDRPDLGSSVEHAALVVPSWRWGSAAFGIHHIGVDGIEARDSRNVALPGELSSSETEIAFGYARPLGEAWSLGAALKLQSQSLAGFAASALAADAGVRVALGPALHARWLEGVSGGLAIRNLLEPALRLDRESVSDPRVWRGGLGWQGALAGGRELSVALGADYSAGVAARLHAGAELRVLPLLAIRGGLDDGRLTAGAGVRWHDLEISYGFEDGTLDPIHRVGVSHTFGRSTAARREASRAAQEQALQTRLDDEFQRRRSRQLGDLLGRAEEARQRSDFNLSLELLGAAGTLDSADTRVRALEIRTQRELGLSLESDRDFAAAALAFRRALALAPDDSLALAGERRARARMDHLTVRDSGRRRAFEAALDAFANGDLVAARAGFAALAGRDSADTEARAMLRRTQEAIARQAAAVVRVRPPAEPAVAPPARVVSEADRRQAEELFRRGVAALSAGRSDDALHYWELALSLDPATPNAARYLNREYLVRGMDAYAAGRLDEAVGFWEKAQRADPTDARAAGFLERARERQQRTREILGGSP